MGSLEQQPHTPCQVRQHYLIIVNCLELHLLFSSCFILLWFCFGPPKWSYYLPGVLLFVFDVALILLWCCFGPPTLYYYLPGVGGLEWHFGQNCYLMAWKKLVLEVNKWPHPYISDFFVFTFLHFLCNQLQQTPSYKMGGGGNRAAWRIQM